MTRITHKAFTLAVLMALAWAASLPALACSICGCGDPLQSISEVAPKTGSFRLGLDTEVLTATAGVEGIPGRTESLTQATLTTVVGYSPSKDLSLTLFVPMVGKEARAEGGGDPLETSSHLGFGDLNLAARWYFFQSDDFRSMERTALALTLGSSLPTGNNDVTESGVRVDEHDQLGMGGWGPFAGLFGTLGGETWDFSASFTCVSRTENSFAYRYGTALRWGAQGRFKPSEDLALSFSLDGRSADADLEDGTLVANTGGTVLSVVPGLWWSPADSLGFYGKVQFPLLTELLGEQTVGATVLFGTQWILD